MSLYEFWLSYPKILQEKDWNKHKGVLTKILKGKTGISELLKKAETAFDRINPAYWSETTVDTTSKAGCAKALKGLSAEYSRSVKPCTDALREVSELAEKTSKEFQKNKLVPRSSRQHLDKIANAAQELSDNIRRFINKAKTQIDDAAKVAA